VVVVGSVVVGVVVVVVVVVVVAGTVVVVVDVDVDVEATVVVVVDVDVDVEATVVVVDVDVEVDVDVDVEATVVAVVVGSACVVAGPAGSPAPQAATMNAHPTAINHRCAWKEWRSGTALTGPLRRSTARVSTVALQLRPLVPPRPGALQLPRQSEQGLLVSEAAEEMGADREAGFVPVERDGHGGEAGEVGEGGELDVVDELIDEIVEVDRLIDLPSPHRRSSKRR
jgi:hypothetical protein